MQVTAFDGMSPSGLPPEGVPQYEITGALDQSKLVGGPP